MNIQDHAKRDSKISPTYRSWSAMLTRCNNNKSISYKYYGAKGISVCPEWRDFGVFFRDMGPRPEGMTLDRINGQLGYFKENCRWATPAQQSINRSIKDICIRGHSLSDLTSVHVSKEGWRSCRKCRAVRAKVYRKRYQAKRNQWRLLCAAVKP